MGAGCYIFLTMTNGDQTRQVTGNRLSMRNTARLILLVSAIFLFSGVCFANDIYIAQSASGTGNGSSCANSRAASFFNSSGNWGAGAAQIGPGTVVHLCGAVSNLTFQGNGASGNPVIVDGTGATFAGDFTLSNRQYWTIRNVTWSVGSAGGFDISGGAFGLITGNQMDMGSGAMFLGQNNGLPHDIVISNNFIRNSASNSGADLIATEGAYNITIEGNYFENRATNNESHVDCIQTWQSGGGSAGPPHDITIRYNYFVMNTTSQNNKSFHMLEGLTGPVNIYGNVYVGQRGGSAANGINFNSNQSSMVANIYGNTMVQRAGGTNNLMNLKGSGHINVRNNVVYSTDAGNSLTGDGVSSGMVTRDHNLWFGPGSPSCTSTEICNRNPNFTNLAGNDFSLQTTSPAVGTGASLGAPYNRTPVQGAQWPNPMLGTRPGGAWDMGAFVNSSGTTTAPAPPTGLAVFVQ